MVSCPARTYRPHILSLLRGRAPAAASLPVGDGGNTDDLQVTQNASHGRVQVVS